MTHDDRPTPSLPVAYKIHDGQLTVEERLRRRGGIPTDVAEYVRDQILSGAMQPGTKVDQEAIGATLGVSRSPIREAIVILGKEGLLDLTPRRGASVAQLSPDDIIDHYELFGLVSGRVAAIAAAALTDEQLGQLAAVHVEFERSSDAAPAVLAALNDRFHQILNSVAPRRTRWLIRLLVRSVPSNYFEFTDGWNERAVAHHAEILAALQARDADRARTAMEHHLHESGVAAADALQRRGFWT